MLVLSRKMDEKLVIGDDVVITISKICGNRVAVAIDAPKEVSIRRGELVSQDHGCDAKRGNSSVSSLNVAAYHA